MCFIPLWLSEENNMGPNGVIQSVSIRHAFLWERYPNIPGLSYTWQINILCFFLDPIVGLLGELMFVSYWILLYPSYELLTFNPFWILDGSFVCLSPFIFLEYLN